MAVQRDLTPRLIEAAQNSPSITLTGPRQSGKTTLAKTVFPQHSYVSLEAPDVRAFASEDPRAFLSQYPDGAIIDEVQRVPELLSYLQGIIDATPKTRPLGPDRLAEPLPRRVSEPVSGRTNRSSLPSSNGPERGCAVHPPSDDP